MKQREFFDSQGVRRIKVLDPSSEARFMDSILPKPPKLPEKGVKVLDSVVASKLKAAQPLRYIQGESFTYCDILDGAVLDSLAHLDNLSGPLGSKNPRKDELAKLVDETARKIFNDVLVYFSDADPVVIKCQRYLILSLYRKLKDMLALVLLTAPILMPILAKRPSLLQSTQRITFYP